MTVGNTQGGHLATSASGVVQIFLDSVGDVEAAVAALVSRSRSYWEDLFDLPAHASLPGRMDPSVTSLLDQPISVQRDPGNPLQLTLDLLGEFRRSAELRYAVMRRIQADYGVSQSAALMHSLQRLAAAMNSLLSEDGGANLDLRGTLLGPLARAGGPHGDQGWPPSPIVRLFLELCRATGRLWSHPDGRHVRMAGPVDAEALLSSLFGMPTSILGFDDLFGGAGLMLASDPCAAEAAVNGPASSLTDGQLAEASREQDYRDEKALTPDGVGSRTVLVRGPSGVGKTLLALQLAVEVARKGGLAWVVAFEQSPEECLYSLAAMGIDVNGDPTFHVETDARRLIKRHRQAVEKAASHKQGMLAFFVQRSETYVDLLDEVSGNLGLFTAFPLGLLVLDPLNAMAAAGSSPPELRARTVRLFEAAKRSRVNLLMVLESNGTLSHELQFEENVSDTVIELGLAPHRSSRQRYVSVIKSRLQREQSGRHGLIMTPGRGLSVRLSLEAQRALLPTRASAATPERVDLGLPGLQNLLGEDGVRAGDVILIQGPSGTSKTLLGLRLVMGPTWGNEAATSLVMSNQRASAVRELLLLEQQRGAVRDLSRVRVRTVRQEDLTPSNLLDRLRIELFAAEGSLDRILLSNVAQWQASSPALRDDTLFGITLVDLLRSSGAVSVVLSGLERPDTASPIQRAIADSADCVIEFAVYESKNQQTVQVTVLKTRTMQHSREPRELVVTDHAISFGLAASSKMLRPDGSVQAVPVGLFLHAETPMQREYNDRMLQAIRATLSPNAEAGSHRRRYEPMLLGLGTMSAVNEIQVYQIDQFELGSETQLSSSSSPFHVFPAAKHLVADRVSRMQERVLGPHGLVAVPYYENISLLALRVRKEGDQEVLDLPPGAHEASEHPFAIPTSWSALADICDELYDGPELVFDCMVANPASVETYNCFFMEILLESGRPGLSHEGTCVLTEWLCSDAAVNAKLLFRRLCRKSYLRYFKPRAAQYYADPEDPARREMPRGSGENAVVWRHWYNTLHQMLSEMGTDKQAGVRVQPLFGNITTAGEWYLGVPAHSTAPEVALKLIEVLTTPQAEFERVSIGVGLPTRKVFYDDSLPGRSQAVFISPVLSLDRSVLRSLVDNAFQRSQFGCYARITRALAAHLQSVLEIPGHPRDAQVQREVRRLVQEANADLRATLNYLLSGYDCDRCPVRAQAQQDNATSA